MSKFTVLTPTEFLAAKKAADDAGKQFYRIDVKKTRQNANKTVTYYDEELLIGDAYVRNPRMKAINLVTTNNVQKHNDPKRRFNGCEPQIRKSSTSTGKDNTVEPFGEALSAWCKLYEAEAKKHVASKAIYAKNNTILSGLQESFDVHENNTVTTKMMDDPIIRFKIDFPSEVNQKPVLTAEPRGDFKMVDAKLKKLVPLTFEGTPFNYGNMHELLRYGTSISGNFGSTISLSGQGVSRKIILMGAVITPGVPNTIENNFDADEMSAIFGDLTTKDAPAAEAPKEDESEDDDIDGLGATYGAD
jgi:hypothetical protein